MRNLSPLKSRHATSAVFCLLVAVLALPGSALANSTITRNASFSYDATYNEVTEQTVQPGDTSHQVQTTIGYDQYGNATSAGVTPYGSAARNSSATYDSQGEFPVTVTNALGQSDTLAHNAAFGETTSLEDPNSLTATSAYDTFGRPTTMTKPDGNKVVTTYLYCSGINSGTATCPTYGAYLVQTTPENSSGTQNGPTTTTYFNASGHVIETDTQGFDGSTIKVSTQYGIEGRVSQTSRPYFSGGTPKWTSYTYDVLARVTVATFPDSSTKTFAYHGLTTAVTNGDSHTTTTVKNAEGKVASRTDAAGNTTSFVYDAFGAPLTVTDPNGNTISNTFDTMGNKTASSDPDMGSWSYAYDPLGELTSQTDAKSQTTTLAYDVLGRVTQRVEASLTSNWVYDPTGAVGGLASACTGSGCSSPSNASYFRAQAYDSLSRPSSVALTIGGTTNSYAVTYDGNGRIATVTYPSGFVAQYVYTSLGYLSQIKDSSSGTVYWQANARDAELHLTQATAGNGVITNQSFDSNTGRLLGICATPDSGTCDGATANFAYTWDPIGNLETRADTYEGFTESFCYDNLNRLTSYALGGSNCSSGTVAKTVSYDALGNITAKSDVGFYGYGNGAGPHAVSFIAGTVNGVVNPTFTYDANGNMTAGDGRSVSYMSFNMAASITQGTNTDCLTYDSEHQRITQVQTTATCAAPGGSASTTTYLNDPTTGAKSEIFVSGTTTTRRDYMMADGQIVAERFNTAGTISVLYFNSDHLGSASILTASNGTVQERDGYDAWGKRRNPNGTDNPACSIASATTRGYTGQEMMDSVCEINLNARIYDPTIARMMSADPTIPDPMKGQSYNRYSYVNNGPLSATDPTGYWTLPGGATGTGPITSVGVKYNTGNDGYGPSGFSDPFDGYVQGSIGDYTPPAGGFSDAAYGDPAPCYGCDGPGETTDLRGNIVPASQALFDNANQLTFKWNGQTQTCSSAAACQELVNGILNENTGPLTFDLSQIGVALNDVVSRSGSGGVTTGGSTAVVDCGGCNSIWSVSAIAGTAGSLGAEGSLADFGPLGVELAILIRPLSFVSQHDLEQMKIPVYRVYDGIKSKLYGLWWGPANPSQMSNWRDQLAVYPAWNAGTFYAAGTVSLADLLDGSVHGSGKPGSIAGFLPADPALGGGPYSGQGVEWRIPNAAATVKNVETFPMH